ncbi:MAG: prolyl oligopeptidase family serine peptidase [Myxococcales bacterium]|nr:prolyl oligopeptidase family serine peptidase [Myxococcales bacterium]
MTRASIGLGLALALGGCALDREGPADAPAASAQEAATPASGVTARALTTADGRARSYWVYTPRGYDPSRSWPMVLVLHGGGGNAEGAQQTSFTPAAADKHGLIAVYPEGIGKSVLGRRLATWNTGRCCGLAAEEHVDDVAFLRAVVDAVARTHAIDRARVFATGISNGGMMSERLACEAPELVAGVAVVGSPGYGPDCRASAPVAVQVIHGTEDHCAEFSGGDRCGGCWEKAIGQALGAKVRERSFPCVAAHGQAASWRAFNRCAGQGAVTYQRGGATCTRHDGCTDGALVELCVVEGGGHTWPGSQLPCDPSRRMCAAYVDVVGPTSRDLDANDAIAGFFADVAKARGR